MAPDEPTPKPNTPPPGSQPSAGHYVSELPLAEELQALLGAGYIVEGFLGQGGMGAVYQGLQMPLKRPVAIKILQRKNGADDFGFEERFKREAYAMAGLTHPNIVQVYDCGDAGEHFLFISMELVEGGDLSHAIKAGLTPETALKLIPQICDGLQAAHERGIVHRDIKPANIFLTKDGRAKVADFGLAKKFDAKNTLVTKTGLGMGTPDYAAPEQYEGVTDIDHRADIYALGVMMYQMITGALPRGNYKLASQRAGTDPRIDAILGKAMENERADRHQSVAEIKAELSAIVAPAPKISAPLSTKVPLATPSRPASTPVAVSTARAATVAPRKPATQPAPAAPAKKSRGIGVYAAIMGVAVVLAVGAWMLLKPKVAATSAIVSILTSPDYEWSAPENLGPAVNTPAEDARPALSGDELVLIFARKGPGTGELDLFEARRASIDQPFGPGVPIDSLNTIQLDTAPFLSRDGLTLTYESWGPGSLGGGDIFQAKRPDRGAPWGTKVSLGPVVNTTQQDNNPCLSDDSLTLFLNSNREGPHGINKFWRSHRPAVDAAWGVPELLAGDLNGGKSVQTARLLPDQRTLLFSRMEPLKWETAQTFLGIPDASGRFTAQPLKLPVNGAVIGPVLSADGRTLYFGSKNLPGGLGNSDLWKISRVPKVKGTSATAQATGAPVPAQELRKIEGDLQPTPAFQALKKKGGRLLVEGTTRGIAVDISSAKPFGDFVEVYASGDGWLARRANGEALIWTTDGEKAFTFSEPSIKAVSTSERISFLTTKGELKMIGTNSLITRKEDLSPKSVFPVGAFAASVAFDGDGMLITTNNRNQKSVIASPVDLFRGAIGFTSGTHACVGLYLDQPPKSWSWRDAKSYDFPAEWAGCVQASSKSDGLVAARNRAGKVFVGNATRPTKVAAVEPPSDLPPAIQVRAGGNTNPGSAGGGMCAAQMTDGTWRAWGMGGPFIQKVNQLRVALDLDFTSDNPAKGYLIWIQP